VKKDNEQKYNENRWCQRRICWAIKSCTKFCKTSTLRFTFAISAYHHRCCEFESRSGRGVQHYVIKFVIDLREVVCFLRVLRFPPQSFVKHLLLGFLTMWVCERVRVMVFNATFNNISVISWRSVLLVEESGGPGENKRPP
jgi:hypothetical protein